MRDKSVGNGRQIRFEGRTSGGGQPAKAQRGRFRLGWPLTLALILAAGAARAAAPAQVVTVTVDGQTSTHAVEGERAVTTAANVPGGTPMVTTIDPERVLIQLHGQPLARAGGRTASAAAALALQHQRAAAAIAQTLSQASGRSPAAAAAAIEREYSTVFNGFAARIPVAAQAQVRALADVAAIHPDREMRTVLADSVPLIGAPTLWSSSGYRGAGEVVAIVDTGIDYTHADLGGCLGAACKVIGGYDFVNADTDPLDDNGHGTHVASTVAGSGTFNGVAPDASLLAYKVCSAFGGCSTSDIIAGIERATDPNQDSDTSDHADVINMSLGGPGDPDDPLSQAADNATAAGVLVVAAAGNAGNYFTVGSPGASRSALTVAATTKMDVLADFSSRGPAAGTFGLKPEIAAPGVDICAARASGTGLGPTCTDTTHIAISGTSMATPHVAGAGALLRGLLPSLSPAEIKSLLVQSSHELLGYGALSIGAGRLDVVAAAAARTAVDPAAVSFGLDDLNQAVWAPSQAVAIRNLSAAARSYSLTTSGLPSGATLTPVPSSFSLASGQTAIVALNLSVNNASVPSLSFPYAYDQVRLTVTAGAEVSRVPVVFLKSPILRLHFDVVPSMVIVHNRAAFGTTVTPSSTTTDVLVPNDTYDVIATFPTSPPSVVVHEGVVVDNFKEETILSSEAVHTVSFDPRDEVNAPLYPSVAGLTFTHRASGAGITSLSAGGLPLPIRTNSVSNAYDLAVAAMNLGLPKQYLVIDGEANGITGDLPFGNTAADLAPATLRYHPRPGQTDFSLTDYLRWAPSPYFSFGFGNFQPWTPADVSFYATAAPSHPFPFYVENQINNAAWTQTYDAGAYTRGSLNPGTIEVYAFGDPNQPTYATTTGELPLDLGPLYFARRFANQSGYIQFAWSRFVCLSFYAQGGDGPEGPAVPWSLSSGNSVVASGTVPQSGLGCSYVPPIYPGIPVADGSYRFDVGDAGYAVAGQAGTTRATAEFDTAASDPNPPAFDGLEIRGNGLLTDVADPTTPVVVSLKVLDSSLVDVDIEYDNGSGWVDLPVVAAGPDTYEATIVSCQAGGVSLRVTATDSSGNSLRQEFNPAYLCRVASCGNGTTEAGEACDDGNTVSGDGCNATCTSTEVCGNGVVDFPGEQCDDGGVANGDGCSSTCTVDTGWSCSGTPSICTTICGDGIVAGAEQCDDGNTSSGDCCPSNCQLSLVCGSPGRTVFSIKDEFPDSRDRLQWQWLRGSLAPADLGNPLATTGYHLCVWDDGAFVLGAAVAGGGSCDSRPCWSSLPAPGGFKYKNSSTNAQGLFSAVLKQGSGNGKIVWKGRGDNLPLPGQRTPYAYFAQTSNVTVRLLRDDAGACWQSVYTSSKRNDYRGFRAVGP